MSAAVARHVGARHVVITDINPVRLALAAQVADVTPVDVSREELPDVMARLGLREGLRRGARDERRAGSPFSRWSTISSWGGKIAMLGIPARPFAVDWTRVVFRMLTIKGIYGREMFETWYKMLASSSRASTTARSSPTASAWMISPVASRP